MLFVLLNASDHGDAARHDTTKNAHLIVVGSRRGGETGVIFMGNVE